MNKNNVIKTQIWNKFLTSISYVNWSGVVDDLPPGFSKIGESIQKIFF